jgi:hypothetical protein
MGIHHMVDELLRPPERIDCLQILGVDLAKVEPGIMVKLSGPTLLRNLLRVLLALIKAVGKP